MARPNIISVTSSISPATATATPVIISPIPIAVISIILYLHTLHAASPEAVRQVHFL